MGSEGEQDDRELRRDIVAVAVARRPGVPLSEVRSLLEAQGWRVSAVELAADLAAVGVVVESGDSRDGLWFRESPRPPGTVEPYAYPGVVLAVAFGVAVLLVCVALVLAG